MFDYFVAPAHERTNWALGLGLPMFVLTPDIGPFAPLNHEVLCSSGAAVEVHAGEFSDQLHSLATNGRLASMAEAGWHPDSISGFAHIADYLCDRYSS
jgi:hypothetical protein